MPEITIPVGRNIGPGYIDWESWEYMEGFTVDDIRMHLRSAEYDGIQVTGILLQFGICYGGLTSHAMEIHNYLRGLAIPVRAHVLSMTASSGTIVALAADEVILEHTAQWMVHRPLYPEGTYSQRSEDLRADADRIDRDEQSMIDIYAARTSRSEDEIRELIKVDRFMSATEAKAFGFVDTVNPLSAKAKAPSAAQAQARLKNFKQAVARADKHAITLRTAKPTPKAKTKAATPATTPRPMAKKVIPISAAARAAAKPAALSPQQKANANAVAALAKSLGVKAEIEGADDEPEAAIEPTELDNGALLYTDGVLAVDSPVYNDEALTEPTGDGVYVAADGREITVASGLVTDIAEASEDSTEEAAAAPASADAITAAVTAALAPITARLDKMEGTFNKAVPPTPRPMARGVQAPDPKAVVPKAKGLLAGASVQK